MASESGRPTFGSELAREVLEHVAEKRLLGGGYNARLANFLVMGHWIFQKGAVLGRARCDHYETLFKMFSQPGKHQTASAALREVATDGLQKCGGRPNSIRELWLKTCRPLGMESLDLDKLKQLKNEKVRLGELFPLAEGWCYVGIGFGATFPELTERLWKKEYDTAEDASEREIRAISRQAGLNVPEEKHRLTWDQMENTVLATTAAYASDYFPELVEPLDLRRNID